MSPPPEPSDAPARIRRATRADLPSVGRLGALLVRTHHELDPKRFFEVTAETERGYASFLGSQLALADTVVLVAERGGEVVGYAYGGVEGYDWMALRGPAGVVHDVVVDPAHRRGGVGRSLLEAIVAELEKLGAPRVLLSTAARNEAARRLFTRAGFRATMIEMTRELGSSDPSR